MQPLSRVSWLTAMRRGVDGLRGPPAVAKGAPCEPDICGRRARMNCDLIGYRGRGGRGGRVGCTDPGVMRSCDTPDETNTTQRITRTGAARINRRSAETSGGDRGRGGATDLRHTWDEAFSHAGSAVTREPTDMRLRHSPLAEPSRKAHTDAQSRRRLRPHLLLAPGPVACYVSSWRTRRATHALRLTECC